MQYADPDTTWIEWATANADVDMPDADRLTALHEFIEQTAREFVRSGSITTEWANKKLAKLGVAARITQNSAYTIEAQVTGRTAFTVYATNRADAEQAFRDRVANDRQTLSRGATVTSDVQFNSGPEDFDPTAPNPEAPVGVTDTLDMLREVIMLGNISGPRWDCDSGTNKVLASYGLAPVPARMEFTVSIPIEGAMTTKVEAYDEESAKRVAGWRWDNGRTGYALGAVTDTDVLAVTGSQDADY
jgi:hypothetical protein